MYNNFLFSKEHLIILFLFSIYIYICPKLTKNLLPYSYIIEKIICILIILEIVLEQIYLIYIGGYDVFNCLPIDASRICAYLGISILFFKKYQLFNIFFSWSLVCAIGDIIFFKHIPNKFPDTLYILYIFSKTLLIYINVYLVEIRKFRISENCIKENIISCIIYFTSIIILNKVTNSNYYYGFSNTNIISILCFLTLTSIVYIPIFLSDKDNSKFKFKKK